MSSENPEFTSGDQLGDFRILRHLGRGGMGSVYLAEDERLSRQVALKVVLPTLATQSSFRRRFEAEARAAAAIDHPNVVPILSAGSVDGNLYLAMRYIEGVNLDQALRATGPLSPTDSARILNSVAAGLDAAHAAGLVHRDVTPANILLQGDLGREGVYLTDFGLVRGVDSNETRLTNTGQLIANLDYASPEQVTTGWVDARTDVYSLGCVLYRMLSGSRPFPGTDTQKMWKIVNEPVPPVPGPGELSRVVARATAKDPADRFPSAGDLAGAASAALEGRSTGPSERSVASGPAAAGYSESAEEPGATEPLATEPLATEVFVGQQTTPRALQTERPSRRRLWISGGALAILVLAALAAILVGGESGNSGREGTRTPAHAAASEAPKTTVKTTSESAEDRFQGQLYSVEPPSGWGRDPEVIEEPPSYPNLWRQSEVDEATYLRTEGTTVVEGQDPVEAEEGSRQETSKSPGYHEIGFGPVTIEGRSAARWDYEVEGDRRVVYGFVECGTGLAVVGSTDPGSFSSREHDFEAAADSLRANCAGNSSIPVVKTYGSALVKPSTLYVSPTNGPTGKNLAWTGWGEPRAVATGKMYYDTCEPDCSRGYGSTDGRAVLSELHDCEGQLQYTVVRFIYDGLPEHNFWGEYGCAGNLPRTHIGE
ncbi:MAG TPA: serine/threonine-protein kinase [Solirubrobacterales bacterium]